MKCRQAQELMGAYLYGDLSPEEMRDLRLHTQECALCREDLAARGRVVSSLSNTTPKLSDEERQRIAWSVKGAVSRRKYEERPLIVRLAPAFVLAVAVLVAGFALGRVTPQPGKHSVARESTKEKAIAQAQVEVKEKTPPDEPKIDDATSKALAALQLLNSMRNLGTISQPDRGNASGSRGIQEHTRSNLQPDSHVKMTPDLKAETRNPLTPDVTTASPSTSPKESGESPDKTQMETDQGKLPKVTDPKNAETIPSESQ